MEIGDRINDRYKIKRVIGVGGMAKVFLARDLILDRDVAVKILAYDFENEVDSLRRFKREALSTTELVHPNIVNIYDVEEDGTPYIVMEYVKGTDLKEYIKNNHPIPYRKVIDIMEQILDAIQYAHENNIIHRDIKPQNILIDKQDSVKITDFGIAVALSQNSITQTNSLLGSVHYLSPEQARGSMVTKKSDIYSLGIVLFELLTGDVPFNGESAVSIAIKHFQNPLPSIKKIDSRIPQPLENVVLKSTVKDPIQRYESVAEMKEDLRTSLAIDRSGEERFETKDINEDETMVIAPIKANNRENNLARDNLNEEPDAASVGENKEQPRKKRRKWPWVLLIILILLFLFFIFFPLGPNEIQVPEVEGMTQAEAERQLEEFNLYLGEIFEVTDDEYEEGIIVDSNPSSGATIREEQDVNLYVSTGKEEYALENYENEPFEEVRAQLTELGFTVEVEEVNSESVSEGNIISQDVEPGNEVVPDETTITFEVSAGPAGFAFRDLSGYSRPGVDDYVEQYNLNLTVEEASSDTVPEGQVISQQPEAGSTLYANSQITVTISTGPEETESQEFSQLVTIPYSGEAENSENSTEETEGNSEENTESGSTSEGGSQDSSDEEEPNNEAVLNSVQIYISDARREMENPVHEFDMSEETQVLLNFTVEEGSNASYRIVRDGEIIEEETVEP